MRSETESTSEAVAERSAGTRGRGLLRWSWLFAFLAITTVARLSSAASVCFPPGGGGVPGQPGLPDWWTGTAPYDDPRWIGSYGFSHGTVNFSSLVETTAGKKYLLLRWHVNPDPGPAVAGDQIWVGFFNTTTNAGTVLQFTRDTTASVTAGTVGAGVMTASAYTRTGTSGAWASGTVPATIQSDARLDATCDTSTLPVTCDDWVIRLRVPLAAADGGIDLGTTFDMWYEADVEHGGTTDRAKWPVGAADVDPTTLPLSFPEPLGSVSPASAAWFNASTAGGMCVAGIGIQSGDISVANAIGAGTQIDVNSANTFHAKPTNNTTTAYNPDSIKANLRIADWGSAIGDSPRWQTIPDPSCAGAIGSGAPGSITGGTHFDLTCSWTLTAGQKCSYRPDLFPGCTPDATLGTRYPHQCIMAELSSTAAPIAFSNSSAWNNFDFDHSSKLERKARIDVGNLGPRDVYVYVRANNMPATVPPAPPPGNDQGQTPGLTAALRERLAAVGAIVPGRVTEKQAQALRTLAATGKISYGDVEKVMPTYTAYVWHDTGSTVKTATGPAKLLAPQPSFTLFVSHDGPLVGWKHALLGTGGATVTEIAPHFYKLSVGPTGSTEVLTSIEALEQLPPPLGGGGGTLPPWLLLLILLLLLLLVVIMFMRRKKKPAGP
jgi:hypothetical protein